MYKIVKTKGGAEVEIKSRTWKDRIYFSATSRKHAGQACWSTSKQAWVSVPKEFGNGFKADIAEAFGLN